MASVQALVLAAGRGSRLGKRSLDSPKCLLEIGRRRLIEHQLEALADAGVGPVRLVVGYGANEIRELVGIRAEYINNPRWETTNSLYSFWLARDAIDGPVMILNSDVLFAPEIIGRLLDAKGDAVAVDSSSGSGREHMKVRVVASRLVDMGKDLPVPDAFGENVGILKLTAETARRLFDKAGEIIEGGGEKNWLGMAVREVARERELRVVDIAGHPWVEIDFPVDLDRARREVWPAIDGGSWKRSWLVRYGGWGIAAALLIAFTSLGLIYSGSAPAPIPEWESVPITNLQTTHITLEGERFQSWWVLEPGEAAAARVVGPSEARIESRLLDKPGDPEPYVLEVLFDGARLDYFKETTRPSGKASHDLWKVSHKERFTVDVPNGGHSMSVRLIAPPDASCLIRIRQIASEYED